MDVKERNNSSKNRVMFSISECKIKSQRKQIETGVYIRKFNKYYEIFESAFLEPRGGNRYITI